MDNIIVIFDLEDTMLGQRINELRKAREWNQIDLAKKLNITKQTVSNWEKDNILPSIEMIVKISYDLGASTDFLLDLTISLGLTSAASPQRKSHIFS